LSLIAAELTLAGPPLREASTCFAVRLNFDKSMTMIGDDQ
jgi:hypothetical protein